MLIGEYQYKVDNKGRLPLPPKFRHEFTEGLVMTRGFDDCIIIHRKADFEKMAERFASSALARSKMRKLSRFIFSNAFDTQLDKQGRIAIPQALKGFARITSDVVIVGDNNRLELWSPEKWAAEQKETAEQAWQAMESFEDQQ